MRFPFSNHSGMSQIICICMLLITICFLHNYPVTTMCLTLVNASISWNTTLTTIVIFGKISACPIDYFSHTWCALNIVNVHYSIFNCSQVFLVNESFDHTFIPDHFFLSRISWIKYLWIGASFGLIILSFATISICLDGWLPRSDSTVMLFN